MGCDRCEEGMKVAFNPSCIGCKWCEEGVEFAFNPRAACAGR